MSDSGLACLQVSLEQWIIAPFKKILITRSKAYITNFYRIFLMQCVSNLSRIIWREIKKKKSRRTIIKILHEIDANFFSFSN